jgi:hypothetical protein
VVTSGSFWKIIAVAHIFGLLFHRKKICINFDKKWSGFILGDFLQTHLATLNAAVKLEAACSDVQV